MVGILPPGTEIPVATKMTILRPACYKKFAAEIDALYSGFENGIGQAKRVLEDQGEMQVFLRDTITNVLSNKGEDLESNTDLFAYGVDSLQATRIRNVIQKSIELNGRTLGQNVVYEHPSIEALSTYLLGLMSGMDQDKSTANQHQVMLDMVDKWSSRLIQDRSAYRTDDIASSAGGEVVLLTGATGSLGAHILDCLIRSPTVSKVICLSRAKSHEDSLRRVQASLRERMRPATCLDKVVSFTADVNKVDLGLSSAEYELLRTEVTTIVHNAWPVNFVLSTESFDEHVGGAVNLLNLALKSPMDKPPAFYFSSSVGTRQGRYEESVSEDFPDSPETAGPMGYARSKWVVEKVLERAGKTTEATVAVLRIGQLVGDTEK